MKRFKIIFISLFVWFLLHTTLITIDGLTEKPTEADVAVVLGNLVYADGNMSKALEQRVLCGLKLYEKGRVKKIIVSGGESKECSCLEADRMKLYLVKNGVPDSVVIVDNLGKNTRATATNTFKLKDSLHINSVIAVSQYYHLSRTKMLLRKRGFKNVYGACPDYFEPYDLWAVLREFVGYYSQLVTI